MQTIVVPLDESPAAEAALPQAAALARSTGAELTLIRVPDRPPPGVRPYEVRGSAVSYAEEYLGETADRLREQGVRARSATLPEGPVPQAILDAAKEREADLVVMATHGRSGLGRWVYGNVTNGVLARCPVPVLITRSWLTAQEGPVIRRDTVLLVPLDGSAYAEGALPVAEAIAKATGARVGRITIVRGPSGPGVLEAAAEQGAALIVMTAHGRSAPGRQLLGNVADYVLRVGMTPLILVGPAAVAAS